jgi:hypothetical protein
VVPAFLGGGKPYFPLGADLRLRLVEQRAQIDLDRMDKMAGLRSELAEIT